MLSTVCLIVIFRAASADILERLTRFHHGNLREPVKQWNQQNNIISNKFSGKNVDDGEKKLIASDCVQIVFRFYFSLRVSSCCVCNTQITWVYACVTCWRRTIISCLILIPIFSSFNSKLNSLCRIVLLALILCPCTFHSFCILVFRITKVRTEGKRKEIKSQNQVHYKCNNIVRGKDRNERSNCEINCWCLLTIWSWVADPEKRNRERVREVIDE